MPCFGGHTLRKVCSLHLGQQAGGNHLYPTEKAHKADHRHWLAHSCPFSAANTQDRTCPWPKTLPTTAPPYSSHIPERSRPQSIQGASGLCGHRAQLSPWKTLSKACSQQACKVGVSLWMALRLHCAPASALSLPPAVYAPMLILHPCPTGPHGPSCPLQSPRSPSQEPESVVSTNPPWDLFGSPKRLKHYVLLHP